MTSDPKLEFGRVFAKLSGETPKKHPDVACGGTKQKRTTDPGIRRTYNPDPVPDSAGPSAQPARGKL